MARMNDCVEISFRLRDTNCNFPNGVIKTRVVLREAAEVEGKKMRKQCEEKLRYLNFSSHYREGKVFVRELTKGAKWLPMVFEGEQKESPQKIQHHFQVVA